MVPILIYRSVAFSAVRPLAPPIALNDLRQRADIPARTFLCG